MRKLKFIDLFSGCAVLSEARDKFGYKALSHIELAHHLFRCCGVNMKCFGLQFQHICLT
jgi:site-specific DNA-cytosine methylase